VRIREDIHVLKVPLYAALIITCAGCGGGGTAPAPSAPPPPTSFNLAAARQSWAANGLTVHFQVTGNDLDGKAISGSADYDASPAASTTADGQPAVSQVITITGTVNGAPYSSSETDYSDPSGDTLMWNSSGDFDVAQSPFSWPSTIAIGDSGTLGTFSAYSDETLVVPIGTKIVTYSVRANPTDPNTAVFALLAVWTYSTGGYNEEVDYTVTASGAGSTISRLTMQHSFLATMANLVLQAN
jgi:hypothetical protein